MVRRPSDWEIASQFNELHLASNFEPVFFPIWQVPQSKIALATSAKEAE